MRTHRAVVGVSVNNLTKHYGVRDLLDAVRLAEDLGFDAIWVHDAPMGRRTVAAYEPVAVLSAAAAVTSRIKLCTGIIQPHLRNPIALAIAWATMDALSGGRSVFGPGVGGGGPTIIAREYQLLSSLKAGRPVEAETFYRERGKLFEESIEIIRRLWTEDKVTHHGRFYDLDAITTGAARPAQRPNPPIVIAQGIYHPVAAQGSYVPGWNEKLSGRYVLGPFERVARLGDGWITCHATPDEYAEAWATIRTHAARIGKNLGGFIQAFNCFVNVNDDAGKARDEVRDQLLEFHGPPVPDDTVDRWAVAGRPEAIIERLERYIAHGVTMFQLVIGSRDQVGQMKKLAERVLPAF
jgi:alkanesulfonate monooxygenase SsuD/methylene tetrahydromethanopterin reductase-like flavin-dependent oxidoreductase (luciferase family)